jgi:hypothetical protein
MSKIKKKLIVMITVVSLIISFSFNNCSANVSMTVSLEMTKVGEIQTGGAPCAIQIKDDLLYIADHLGLLIYNVSDPSVPKKIGENLDGGIGHDVHVENNLAYVADLTDGLEVYNISDPTNPEKIGTFFDGTEVAQVFVQETVCYATVTESIFAVLNVSDPTSIEQLGESEISAGLDICCFGDSAFIADWKNGLLIYDISNSTNPQLVGKYNTTETFRTIFVEKDVVYASCRLDGFKIISVSDPANPVLIGEYLNVSNNIGAIGVYKQDDYAFVCDYDEGLKVLDVSNPEKPLLNGFYSGNRIFSVSVVNEYVYIIQSVQYGGIVKILQINEIDQSSTADTTEDTTSATTPSWNVLLWLLSFIVILSLRRLRKKS